MGTAPNKFSFEPVTPENREEMNKTLNRFDKASVATDAVDALSVARSAAPSQTLSATVQKVQNKLSQ